MRSSFVMTLLWGCTTLCIVPTVSQSPADPGGDDGGVSTFGSLFANFGSLFVGFGQSLYGGKCGASPDGCLLGVLAYRMYQGIPGTEECIEICTLYPSVKTNFTCGSCETIVLPSDMPSLVPSSSPSAVPFTNETVLPSDMPSLSPTGFVGANETLPPFDTLSPAPSATVGPNATETLVPTPVPTELGTTEPSVVNLTTLVPTGEATPPPTTSVPIETEVPGDTEVPIDANATAVPSNATEVPGDVNGTFVPIDVNETETPIDVTEAPIDVTEAPIETEAPAIVSEYDIQIETVNITDDISLFTNAAARWSQIVIGDVGDRVLLDAPDTPPPGCTYPDVIDDLYVCALLGPIDTAGPLNIFAIAGPTWVRGANLLPVAGFMRIDSNDIDAVRADGSLSTIITHEMSHIIGFGNLWSRLNISTTDGDCTYGGAAATAAYTAISGCLELPLEQESQNGTECVHWSEDCMPTELMSAELNDARESIISAVTIGSMQDLGYNVSYATADVYTSADLGFGCTCGQRRHTRGLQGKRPVRRSLSTTGRQAAVDYGRSILQANRLDESSSRMDNLDLVYFGDKIISILLKENDSYYSVVVTNE